MSAVLVLALFWQPRAERSTPMMMRQQEPLSRRFLKAALLVLVLPLIGPLALISVTAYLFHRASLYLLVWTVWLPKGKDILIVYSDSPIWHEYMTTEVLPLVQTRAVVLNWSERKKWNRFSLSAQVFHYLGGASEFNPLVILFRPFCKAKTFRFWVPFGDWKRGYREPVERLRQELLSVL
jgi:hypothetical protein